MCELCILSLIYAKNSVVSKRCSAFGVEMLVDVLIPKPLMDILSVVPGQLANTKTCDSPTS